LGSEPYEGYGLTETSPIVSTNVPGDNEIGTVGRPLPAVRVVIDRSVGVDAHGGEIIVYGPNVQLASETSTPSLELRPHEIVKRYRLDLRAMYEPAGHGRRSRSRALARFHAFSVL
jgi:acyl-CoA synthetase (AMP-forming)/AMP-acid ligase II